MKKLMILVATVVGLLISNQTLSSVTVSADSPGFLYTGRIDFSNKLAPVLSWPGSSVKANFTGTSLSVILDDQRGDNLFNIIVDGGDQYPYVLHARQGVNTYLIGNSLEPGAHSVEIFKRTEGEDGETAFLGLILDNSGRMLLPPKRPIHRIEIYGDSITSGMGNEAPDNGADNLLPDKNNYLAYGSIAGRMLDAEVHTISQSGIGIMVSWFPFTMPDFFDQLSAVGNNDTTWNFKLWTPEVVVVNLFQNDSWLIDLEERIQPVPSDDQIVQSYMNFVRIIRARYPEAMIICALGSMEAVEGDRWPNLVKTAVERMRSTYSDENIDTLFFEFNGYRQHPRIAQHVVNAERLAGFIRSRMGW